MPISKRGSFQDHDFGSNEGSFKSDSSQSESSGGSQLTDNDSASSLSGSARKSTRVGDLFGLSNTEEHAITWCRGCFLFILLAVAGGLATIIYMITAEDQQQSFETEVGHGFGFVCLFVCLFVFLKFY